MKTANSITTKNVYDKEKDEYKALHSMRGIEASYEELTSTPIANLYNKVWRQDDWGLVTIWTEYQDKAVRFVVEHTNLGYGVRAWVNNRPYYDLDGRLQDSSAMTKLFENMEACNG